MSSQIEIWKKMFGLASTFSDVFVLIIVLSFIFFTFLIPCWFFLPWAERKWTADFQLRVGPNRTGVAGVFQQFADFIKTVTKEKHQTSKLFLFTAPLFTGLFIVCLPVSEVFLLFDREYSVVLFLLFTLFSFFPWTFASLKELNNTKSWLVGLRVVTNILYGISPLLVVVFSIAIRSGGLSWTQIVEAQGFLPTQWALFSSPFEFLNFLVILIIVANFLGSTHISLRHSMATFQEVETDFLGVASVSLERIVWNFLKFTVFFGWIWAITVFFLGGWGLPLELHNWLIESKNFWVLHFSQVLIMVLKVLIIFYGLFWWSAVQPGFSTRQSYRLTWESLLGVSLFAFCGNVIWYFLKG